MYICVGCKHGQKCPFTKEADLFHEMLNLSDGVEDRKGKLFDAIKKELKKKGVLVEFNLDVEVTDCQRYEAEKGIAFPGN